MLKFYTFWGASKSIGGGTGGMGNSNIFGYQSFESVKDVLFGLVRLNVKHLLLLHKVKFYKRLYLRSDLVHNLFWVSLISNYIYDKCMTTVLVHYALPWIMYINSFMSINGKKT